MRISGRAALAAILLLLALTAQAMASGITNAGEDLRTGWYPDEPSITPEALAGGYFGKTWEATVEGQVYAQPLLDGSTLLVATEQNKVYGLDPVTGAQRWSPVNLGVPWNPKDIGCTDLTPSIGVTSTPVIDPATHVAYMTHKTYASGTSGHARWYMDAIELATGHEKPGFPVPLTGNAQNAPGQEFEAATELQRPACSCWKASSTPASAPTATPNPSKAGSSASPRAVRSRPDGPPRRRAKVPASGNPVRASSPTDRGRSCSSRATARRRHRARPVTNPPGTSGNRS
jgi:putative pyrroloquinoline-quinone-binding quinoprotein